MPHKRFVTRDTLSSQVPEQLPEFVRFDHPTFVAFLEAYYEWMETQDQALNISFGLRDLADIDDTLEEFVEQFKQTYMLNFPIELAIDSETEQPLDQRRILKNIKAFYKAKGSEKSYKFLFRILFDTNVEFFFPKVDILRASDGKFIIERFMRVTTANGSETFEAVGRKIQQRDGLTGSITASAKVTRAIQFQAGLYEVTEFVLTEIFGVFNPPQRVEFEIVLDDGTTKKIEENIFTMITGFNVTNGGTGFFEGEIVRLINAPGDVGIGALGVVDRVDGTTGAILRISVRDPGTNYLIPPIPDFSESANGTGATTDVLLGPIFTADGFFGNNDGQLSSNKVIQDSFFYQDYSYVLKTEVTIDKWLGTIKKVIHPAGLKVFGEVTIFRCIETEAPHETRFQVFEIPLIGHYTPYTWLTTEDLRAATVANLDLYPNGFDPAAGTVAEDGTGGVHVPGGNPEFAGEFTDFSDLKARTTLAFGSGSGPVWFTMSTVTGGPFQIGEVVEGFTTKANGIVYALDPTGTKIGLLILDGEFAVGETIDGDTSGASTSLTSLVSTTPVVKWGFPYRPKSDPIFIIYHHPNRRGMIEIPGPNEPHPNPNMRIIDRTMLSGVFVDGESVIGDLTRITDITPYISGQDFILGELVMGLTSGATGVVFEWNPVAVASLGSELVLGQITGMFLDGEDVQGNTSAVKITIDEITQDLREGIIDADELPNAGESQVIMFSSGEFSPGENITGQTSGAVARVDSLSNLIYLNGMPWRDINIRDFVQNMPAGLEILCLPRGAQEILSDAGFPNEDIGGFDGTGPTD